MRVKNVASKMQSGGTPDSSNDGFYVEKEKGIPWVTIADMSTVSYVTDTGKYISEEAQKSKNLIIFQPGTILYAMYASVGKVAELSIPATINQALLAIESNTSVNGDFFKYALMAWEPYIISESSGTTQFNLNANKVANLRFPAPNVCAQKHIACFLNAKLGQANTLIANVQAQIEKLKAYMADVRSHGVGNNYLIQHSAGSGKSNSIAWIVYRLASIHDAENNGLFDSVIVVTNRVVLDSQLQDTINGFEHQVGLVEAIDDKKNSRSLAEAINDKKRIIICTIQKFLFAKKDMEKFRGRKFAVIIDEAHQGQNGKSAKSLRRSLIDIGIAVKEYAEEAGIDEDEVDLTDDYINAVIGQGRHENQSFFAFTATPKGKTLESFGTVVGVTPEGEPIKAPFHVYSMRQAIEEGYILDVLANYTTIKEAFKLIRVSEDNPELIEGQASRALFKYYKQHGYTIAQKTEMIMTNFLENCRYQIGGKGKAMVVADSRANAVRYYLAIKKYLADHAEQCM